MSNPPFYDTDHWSQRQVSDAGLERYLNENRVPYNAAKTDLMERLLGDVDGCRVLDYGGGAGYFGLRCARRGAAVTLVDGSATALELAQHLAAEWDVADRITTIVSQAVPPFDAQRFDVVILKDIIEHVHDDAGLLAAAARVQPAGGRLILSTHNCWSLNFLLEGTYRRLWCGERDWCGWDPTHVRFYSPRTLGRLLRNAGYTKIRWASIYIVPYNVASWFLLLRRTVEWPQLALLDRRLGASFPLNRLGWNILVYRGRGGGGAGRGGGASRPRPRPVAW